VSASSQDGPQPLGITRQTTLYSKAAIEAGLEQFPSQALWLLFSLDHYGWRAQADTAYRLLSGLPRDPADLELHLIEHAVMEALDQLFKAVDKIWRVVAGIRAHREGKSFLDPDVGYCAYGGDVAKKFSQLAELTPADWGGLLRVPSDDTISQLLAEQGGEAEEIASRVAFAHELPALCATNMAEIGSFFRRPPTGHPQRETGASLRDLNNTYRHGDRLLYEDCSPTDSGWIAANLPQSQDPTYGLRTEELSRFGTVSVLIDPPDGMGQAFIGSMPYDEATRESLLNALSHLSTLLHRLVLAFLVAEIAGSGYSLASIADFEWEPVADVSDP
jgi:hypothetical protein